MSSRTVYWRRLDIDGLERLSIVERGDDLHADGTVIATEDGGFRLDHRWVLGRDWTVRSVVVTRWSEGGERTVRLARTAGGWAVDGEARPDLDGAEEPDLSVTPFCNTFPLRRLLKGSDASIVLDVAYIDGATLEVVRSRQAYDRRGDGRFRYRDLGLFKGFEADLDIDRDGFVRQYEGLFEMVDPEESERCGEDDPPGTPP